MTFVFNLKPTKTPLPARKQVILGCLYDSVERRVRTSADKQKKYVARIRDMLNADRASVRDVLKLHGNLNYAAGVTPFGRPFLASLTTAIQGLKHTETIKVSETLKSDLRIWKNILVVNRGVTYDFILGLLPRCPDDIFVDASTEWGVGGICGEQYFLFP